MNEGAKLEVPVISFQRAGTNSNHKQEGKNGNSLYLYVFFYNLVLFVTQSYICINRLSYRHKGMHM
jgi:hypothetical protein